MKNANPKKIKEFLKWANNNGLKTAVTMLDVHKSAGRIKSDKDFKTVLALIDNNDTRYFRIILRKQMNLFGISSEEKVIDDMLEIGIRGIDADAKEYFIIIYMDKRFTDTLVKRYDLKMVEQAKK
jgi:hypothetical protein